jgi:hypothetical protein
VIGMATDVRNGLRAHPWWLKPSGLLGFFIIPVYSALWLLDEGCRDGHEYCGFAYGLGMAYLVVFGLFSWMGERVSAFSPSRPKVNISSVRLVLWALFLIAATSYFVWFGSLIQDWTAVGRILAAEAMNVRGSVSNIPGVTSWSQAAVVYSIVFFYAKFYLRLQLGLLYNGFFIFLLGLALFRAFVWSERLAVIEFLLPALILYFMCTTPRWRSPISRAIVVLGPYLGLVLLYFMFSFGEYFRSWGRDGVHQGYDFWIYSLERLINYYSTSVQNGILLLQNATWPSGQGYFVFGWIYHLPWLGKLFQVVAEYDDFWSGFLVDHADPEFNNPSGVFVVFYDLGGAAFLFCAVYGFISGVCYREARRGGVLSSFIFPSLFISWVEMLRIFYLGETRFIPILVLVLMAWIVVSGKVKELVVR